jgi:hypothetical protein
LHGWSSRIFPAVKNLRAPDGKAVFLLIYGSLVSFSSTILNKLNEKRVEGDKDHDVDHTAFVQQKLQHKPNSEQN